MILRFCKFKNTFEEHLPVGVAQESMNFATEGVGSVWVEYFSREVQSWAMQVLAYAAAMDNHVGEEPVEGEAVQDDVLAFLFLRFDSV